MRHKWADVIIAWVEGEKIQSRVISIGEWVDIKEPVFDHPHYEYRIKPKTVKKYLWAYKLGSGLWGVSFYMTDEDRNNYVWIESRKLEFTEIEVEV